MNSKIYCMWTSLTFYILFSGQNLGFCFLFSFCIACCAIANHFLFQEVPASTVKLTVTDNIILQPSSDVYILIGTRIHYKVRQLRRGHAKGKQCFFHLTQPFLFSSSSICSLFIVPQELKLFMNWTCLISEIEMPSNQYRFALDNKGIATLNHRDSSVTGRKLGTVKITLIDNSILSLHATFHV